MGVGVGEEGKKSLLVDGWKRWDLEERSGCHGRVDVMVGGWWFKGFKDGGCEFVVANG